MDMTRRLHSDHRDWVLLGDDRDRYDRNDQMDTRRKTLFQDQKTQQQEARIKAWITQKSAYFVKQIIIEMWLS